jgi:plastocyanin
MRTMLIIAAATLALGAAACSSDSSAGAAASSPACSEPVATTTVDMTDFAFAPACIGAKVDGSLELHNSGDVSHTFTVRDTSVNVDIGNGDSANVQLTGLAAGTYEVICTYHPQMTATLTVA